MSDTEVVPRRADRPDGKPLVHPAVADELLATAEAQGVELLGPDGFLSQSRHRPDRSGGAPRPGRQLRPEDRPERPDQSSGLRLGFGVDGGAADLPRDAVPGWCHCGVPDRLPEVASRDGNRRSSAGTGIGSCIPVLAGGLPSIWPSSGISSQRMMAGQRGQPVRVDPVCAHRNCGANRRPPEMVIVPSMTLGSMIVDLDESARSLVVTFLGVRVP